MERAPSSKAQKSRQAKTQETPCQDWYSPDLRVHYAGYSPTTFRKGNRTTAPNGRPLVSDMGERQLQKCDGNDDWIKYEHAILMQDMCAKECREDVDWGPGQPCKEERDKIGEHNRAKQLEAFNTHMEGTYYQTPKQSEEDWTTVDLVAQPTWVVCRLEPVDMYSERECSVLAFLGCDIRSTDFRHSRKDRQDLVVRPVSQLRALSGSFRLLVTKPKGHSQELRNLFKDLDMISAMAKSMETEIESCQPFAKSMGVGF